MDDVTESVTPASRRGAAAVMTIGELLEKCEEMGAEEELSVKVKAVLQNTRGPLYYESCTQVVGVAVRMCVFVCLCVRVCVCASVC